MFSQLKLAALAKLNFLPSWWFFREMAVRQMKQDEGFIVDDGVMDGEWKNICYLCRDMLEKKARVSGGSGWGRMKEEGGAEEE